MTGLWHIPKAATDFFPAIVSMSSDCTSSMSHGKWTAAIPNPASISLASANLCPLEDAKSTLDDAGIPPP